MAKLSVKSRFSGEVLAFLEDDLEENEGACKTLSFQGVTRSLGVK